MSNCVRPVLDAAQPSYALLDAAMNEAAIEGRPFDLIWVRFGFLIQI